MKKYYAYIVITLFLVLGVFAPLAPTHTSNNTVHYAYAQTDKEKANCPATKNKFKLLGLFVVEYGVSSF